MSDKIREAVKRLSASNYTDYNPVYLAAFSWNRMNDYIRLAEAYLATLHADDGDPVTADWFASVLPDSKREVNIGKEFFSASRHCDYGVWHVSGEFKSSTSWIDFTMIGANDGRRLSSAYIIDATRGQFRKLYAVYGVPLSESGH